MWQTEKKMIDKTSFKIFIVFILSENLLNNYE